MAGESGLPRDPAKRREAKIKQYRREKELREQISVSSSHKVQYATVLTLTPGPSAWPTFVIILARGIHPVPPPINFEQAHSSLDLNGIY